MYPFTVLDSIHSGVLTRIVLIVCIFFVLFVSMWCARVHAHSAYFPPSSRTKPYCVVFVQNTATLQNLRYTNNCCQG